MQGKHSKYRNKKIIVNIILIIFIVVAIISGIVILKWVKENKESKKIIEEISSKVVVTEIAEDEEQSVQEKYKVDFNSLKQINADTVSWIKIEGTEIEYPVVKAKDNSYYLNRSFNKTNNSAGWIFMDYRNSANGTDKNIVIYGHNRKDGSMFGTLKYVFEEEWYNNEKNKYITYITENEYCTYEIFSAYRIEAEDYYITTNFKSNTEFEQFIKKIKSRSFKKFGIEVSANDQILTLSTCSNANYRIAVHAKKIVE